MTALVEDLRTIAALWLRDQWIFLRQRSRVVGAIAQPLLLWLALGSGLAPSFRPGSGGVGYMAYFFPGVVVMLLLFSAISSTMSVIDDRHQGFLQGVLVAPGSRAAVVAGKVSGAVTQALGEAAIFVALAPLAGIPYGGVAWGPLAAVLLLTSIGLTSLGLAIAWWLDSSQGYHVVMSLVLFPQWVLSGAMFPAEGLNPVLAAILKWNPMSYAVAGVRRALSGGVTPLGARLPGSGLLLEAAVLSLAALVSLGGAVFAASRRR
jgi:ABC-2 type transport system permease protein